MDDSSAFWVKMLVVWKGKRAVPHFLLFCVSFSCRQVNDLCEMHIDTVLKEIAKTLLISLSDSGATRVEDMLTLNEVQVHNDSRSLESPARRVNSQSRRGHLGLFSLFLLFLLPLFPLPPSSSELLWEIAYASKTSVAPVAQSRATPGYDLLMPLN